MKKGLAQFSGQALGLLLALVVSHLIARRLGVGADADAFLLGRRLITAITETLHQIIGVVFIPMVAAQAAAGASIWLIIRKSAGAAILLGTALAVALVTTAPQLVASIAPDFAPATQDLAARVIWILALALPAAVATTALSAYCNVRGLFGTPAAIKQAPRGAVALALALTAASGAAIAAAWAYTLAAVAVAALTLALTLRISRRPDTDAAPAKKPQAPATARRGAVAVILAFSALGFLWLETAVAAAQGPGGVAMLDFGQRLGALLGNTLASALILVVFADLSRRSASGDGVELGTAFQRALLVGLALVLPVSLGLVLNAGALVEIVLGYGAFADSDQRAQIVQLVQLMALAPASALVLRMMLVRIVAEDALPMVRLITVAMLVELAARLALFYGLTPLLGLPGIPLTLLLSPVAPALVLAIWLSKRGSFRAQSAVLSGARPLLLAAVATALALLPGAWVLPDLMVLWFGDIAPKPLALLQLALSGAGAFVVMGLAFVVFKVRPRLT